MKKSLSSILLALLGCLAFSLDLRAERQPDSLQVSLLTCAPGEEVYELYGHTALRVRNESSGEDLVFNYGIFDFDTPNFAWRFMTGQTDYTIGVSRYTAFARAYERHGRCVVEQVLNLRPAEEARLYAALVGDWAEPDWTYRYNLLYDNCATRVVDRIRESVDGRLILPPADRILTFRDILHEFSAEVSPWYCFGEDLLLGAAVDRPIPVERQLFAPYYVERYLDRAYVLEADGSRRPLVERKQMAVQVAAAANQPFGLPVMWAFVLLFAAMVALACRELSRGKQWLVVDYVLMALQGLVGTLIAFLFFLSEHPAVDTNWLLVLLNPLPLLYLPVKMWRDRHGRKDYYYPVLLLALLVYGGVVLLDVQKIPAPFHFVALILLSRIIVDRCLNNGAARRAK